MRAFEARRNQTLLRAFDVFRFITAACRFALQNGQRIKYCQNCGRAFIPQRRSDEMYCAEPSPQNKELTCKKYGSRRLWYDRLKNDEVAMLARKVYMAKQNRAARCKNNPARFEACARELADFRLEYKEWRAALRQNRRTRQAFYEWLVEVKGGTGC